MEKARFLMERDNVTENYVLLEEVENAPHLDEESADNGNENEIGLEGSPGSKTSSLNCIEFSFIDYLTKEQMNIAANSLLDYVRKAQVKRLTNYYQRVINTKDSSGDTILHPANSTKIPHTLELLLEDYPSHNSMVEVNAKNNGGITVSDYLHVLPEQEEEVHIKREEILTRAEALRGRDRVEHKPDNNINHEVCIELGNKRYNKPLAQQTTWSEFPTSKYYGLLLAATLLAAMTFHAALNISNEFPIEINHLFILFNSTAFFTSVALITLITYELPINPWQLIIVLSAIGAYMCIIMAVSPHEVVYVLFIGSFISLAAFFKCLGLDKIAADYIQWMRARIQLI